MRKPKWYYDEVFRQNFYFFHKWKTKDFIAYIKKTYNEDYSDVCYNYDGVTIRLKEKRHIMVWTVNNKHALQNLVHEITHATNMTLNDANVKPCFVNDELQAYYNAMLFRKALK